jgi:hypothetical protein
MTLASPPPLDPALAPYWARPGDRAALHVWADVLCERGDPRGEYLALCLLSDPTEAQRQKRATVERKLGGKLVGPARAFLREWTFGADGLVERARCEAEKLAAGWAEIGELSPRLSLTVTSTKSKRAMKALATVSLERIHHLDFTGAVMGKQAAQIDDASFRALVPSIAKVKNLALSCRGYADTCFSPAALRLLGEASEGIEYLFLEHFAYVDDGARPQLAPLAEYVDVICRAPAFKALRALVLPLAPPAALRRSLPHLVTLDTFDDDDGYQPARTAADLVAMKTAAPAQ